MTATTLQTQRPGRKDRDDGQRRCIVTRESLPRALLLRFVVGPDQEIVPDLAERLPGRGLWLTAERDIVARAAAKGAFPKAAKGPARAPADLADRVEALLARRCVELLSLANRAGLVSAGYEKAKAALDAGKAALLLTAADSSGQDARALSRIAGDAAGPSVLTRAELGGALGRDDFVSVALRAGGLTTQLRRELSRLAGFRRPQEYTDAAAGRADAPRTQVIG